MIDHGPALINGGLLILAIVEQYVLWLDGYVAKGGKITHEYDYEWATDAWFYAPLEFISNDECGANSMRVICESWVEPQRGKCSAFGGWGHNNIYLMNDFAVIGRWVPIYSDEIFDGFRDHV